MVRYYGAFTDTEGTLSEFYVHDGLIDTLPPEKPVAVTYERSAEIFQPIQAGKLTVRLYADIEDDLGDLFSEDSRYWWGEWQIDGIVQFKGYLSLDNSEEPYNTDRWELVVEVLDPLALLEDYAYVSAPDTPYTGNDTVINILSKAILKGFDDSNDGYAIRAFPGITLTDDSRFLDNAYIDQSLFLQNDEAVDCRKVVEDILLSFGMFIRQVDGFFYLFDNLRHTRSHLDVISGEVYSRDGVYIGVNNTVVPTQWNRDIYPRVNFKRSEYYHVGENQRLLRKRNYYSTRFKHTYEYRDQILPNGELLEDTGTMPFWTLGGDASVVGDTVEIDGVELEASKAIQLTSTAIKLKEGARISIGMLLEFVDDPITFTFRISITDGVNTKYLVGSGTFAGTWRDTVYDNRQQFIPEGEWVIELNEIEIPIDGDMTIEIYNTTYGNAFTVNSKCIVNEILIKALSDEEEGREMTANRTDKTSGQVVDVEDIPICTTDTTTILNGILNASGQPIEEIKTVLGAENMGILKYLAQQRMSMFFVSTIEYRGDVYGDMTRLEAIGIYNFINPYLPLEVSYNPKTKVSSVTMINTLEQIKTDSIAYNEKTVFKESIKPIIET